MIRALIRLHFVMLEMYIQALDWIIFKRKEITDFSFKIDGFKEDKEKVAFIENLKGKV